MSILSLYPVERDDEEKCGSKKKERERGRRSKRMVERENESERRSGIEAGPEVELRTRNYSTLWGKSRTDEEAVDFTCRLCAAAVSFLLGRIGQWSRREIACSALSLARSAQAERDNESCFFMRAAGVHRFIRLSRQEEHE
ncbi:hypothetical protein EVAR_38476_1 [Eumeta japonica]|uniref:Uncharacterized protein n=1 Tax=Eumeta variegata TaxID=151549 RepID=A0A4C1WN97_EUMVA|nr:hypothetical protein EVAR_38476_1 [Eumeta japonica]